MSESERPRRQNSKPNDTGVVGLVDGHEYVHYEEKEDQVSEGIKGVYRSHD